ncbi:MAG TPA: hypothetical protein VGQ25_09430 [Gemmatimonadales bacterium]|jgi:hypothetical protein|nr:hypothetical protein [Gemmatimonadales bacterium]
MADGSDRMRLVVYYAVWAGICATVAGVAMALIHTWFFSFTPSRSTLMATLAGGIAVTAAIAAGQAAVIILTGSVLTHLGYELRFTVLLGLAVGAFDFVMNLVQLLVPALEPGWRWDLVIVAAATVGITLLGARRPTVSAV